MPPAEWIESMVQSAIMAPSPSNSQPVRFIQIRSKNIREEIHRAMVAGRQDFLRSVNALEKPKRLRNWINTYYRFSEFLFKAPLLFAVGTVTQVKGFSRTLYEAGIIEQYDGKDLDISLGLALKGFLLKGEELGLGTCILTAPLTFIRDIDGLLNIKGISIRCLVTAGFTDENPPLPERKKANEIYRII